MKKVMMILFAIVLLGGCSVEEFVSNGNSQEKSEETTETENAKNNEDKESLVENEDEEVDEVDADADADADVDVEPSDEEADTEEVNTSDISEEKYLESHLEILEIFLESIDGVTEVTGEVESGTSEKTDAEIAESLEIAFSPITALEGLAIAMSEENKVPEKMEEVHNLTVESLSLMSEAGELIIEGVENNMDETLLNEGSEAMNDSIDKINQIGEELKKLR